ncbi:MAG: vancomycin resistance histidine kinase VanS [Bacillota bacterium]
MIPPNTRNTSKPYGGWGIKLRDELAQLRRKILVQVGLTAVMALTLGAIIKTVLIDGILQQSFADGFIRFCQNTLRLPYEDALLIYRWVFRNNKAWWLAGGLVLLLLVIFYYSLLRMLKYFHEVNSGLDQLIEETDAEIILSPEMEFVAAKLNKIKSSLAKRQRDAKEAEQRKNDLVVYLAHDIKTPLTSVIGYLSLLDEAADLPHEQRAKYIGLTLEKAYRLEHLINEFFEITRFNLHTIVLNKEEINLPFMIQQMADEFYPMLAPGDKKVVVDAPEGLVVWGDADKLARVFNNILKNAIAYSFDHSTIEISAAQQANEVAIAFANYGNPIPSHKLDTIFEKFYRLDDSRSTNTGGAGLGLAIAKEIVTAHGGTIAVESNEERTVFTVTLPISEIRKP